MRALSLFTGAGGLDLGFRNSDIEIVAHCENNPQATATLKANQPDAVIYPDVTALTPEMIAENHGHVDIVFGGPPCQSFSTMGKRGGVADPRGGLLFTFLDLAIGIDPEFIVLENVRGLLSAKFPDGVSVWSQVANDLRAAGYSASWGLYDAANFGAAQHRDRLILIARRGRCVPRLLCPTRDGLGQGMGLPGWATFQQATHHITQHHHTQFTPKRQPIFQHIPEGGNWRNLPDHLQHEALGNAYHSGGGKTGYFRRLHRNKPSPTLLTDPTGKAASLCHPTENRPLSVEEYAALQGFPASHIFTGSLREQYRQIGNAVPVPLATAVARALLEERAGFPRDTRYDGFRHSRYKQPAVNHVAPASNPTKPQAQ